MKSAFKGIVHGKRIELTEETGLPDGQEVTVMLQASSRSTTSPLPPGEGIRRSAGAWGDDPVGLDAYIEWTRLQRKLQREALQP